MVCMQPDGQLQAKRKCFIAQNNKQTTALEQLK